MIHIYTDGACLGNPGPGGWAAIVIDGKSRQELTGREDKTTNNRMELMAAIRGLEVTGEGAQIKVHSDSQYLVHTMTRNWKRQANRDLWAQLDSLSSKRTVHWQWVKGHAGHPENERANRLATEIAGFREDRSSISQSQTLSRIGAASDPRSESSLTHLDEAGQARMVDVGWKQDTEREAVARCSVLMRPETLELITKGGIEKGDVLSVARLAGIMGAKSTPQLIPLCHPIALTNVRLDFELDEAASGVHITATAKAISKTGVEMEALTAAVVAALTIYDMCKSADRAMRIEAVRLVRKSGGKSGEIVLEET